MLSPSLRRRLRSAPLIRPLRLARVARQARTDGHHDWSAVIAADPQRWAEARRTAAGPRVLIATDVGLHFGASRLDSLLAVALTLRGARVDVLLCDGALPACMAGDTSWYRDLSRFAENGPQQDFCAICFPPAAAAWATLGMEPIRLGSQLVTGAQRDAAAWAETVLADREGLRLDPLADQALAGALRFFARATLPDTPEATGILRRYLAAAHLSRGAAHRLIAREGYDVVVLHHGIYVPQGPVLLAAWEAGTRIVTWNPAYRKRTFIFSHDDTYHRTMIDEPTARWDNFELTARQEAELDRYLAGRRAGDEDWIVFGRDRGVDAASYLTARGIDPARPVILALTNVAWDAQLHYESNCFATMRDWLVETVRWFADHPDRQLVIRVHPAELSGTFPSEEKAADMVAAAFPVLPENVVIVGPDDPISSYALIEASRAAIIFATKTGIEIAATGKPVVVAGEAWIRGKGIAIDATDPEHYRAILEGLASAPPLTAEAKERARRYAFHYFFRRMIPVEATKPAAGWPPFSIGVNRLAEIEAGADPGLDIICNGILNRGAFEYPAEDQP